MQRYFIDTYDGRAQTRDRTGVKLAHREAARQVALTALSDFVADELSDDVASANFSVVVRDKKGRVIFRAALSFVAETIDHDGISLQASVSANTAVHQKSV